MPEERQLRIDGVNRLSTKVEKMTLELDDLDQFVLLTNRRDITYGHVNKLARILEKGMNFETPLMANYKDKKFRLVDGNHRYEAIKKYLTKYPQRKVEVYVMYYEGLTEDEEREEYTKWNSGKKQTVNNFVQAYWSVIPICKLFDRPQLGFPCKVAHSWKPSDTRLASLNPIEFKVLIATYLTKDTPTFTGAFSGAAMDLIEKAQELTQADFNILKAFMAEYIQIYGYPDPKNTYYRQCVFWTLMRIWLDNRSRMEYQKLHDFFVDVKGHPLIVQYSNVSGSRENVMTLHGLLLQQMRLVRRGKYRNIYPNASTTAIAAKAEAEDFGEMVSN